MYCSKHTIHNQNQSDLYRLTCWERSSGTAAATGPLGSHTLLCLTSAWHWLEKRKELSIGHTCLSWRWKGELWKVSDIRCLDTDWINTAMSVWHTQRAHSGEQSLIYLMCDAVTDVYVAKQHVHSGRSLIFHPWLNYLINLVSKVNIWVHWGWGVSASTCVYRLLSKWSITLWLFTEWVKTGSYVSLWETMPPLMHISS